MDRTYRQNIIDEYLNASGRNKFVPSEFLDWLEPQNDHRAWVVFFGKSDQEAAHEYRLGLARSFVAGLRIKVEVTPIQASKLDHIRVKVETPTVYRVPAFVSAVATRKEGGGYYAASIDDADTMQESYRQAAQALASWIDRWGDTAKLAGADISVVQQVVGTLTSAGVSGAAEAA